MVSEHWLEEEEEETVSRVPEQTNRLNWGEVVEGAQCRGRDARPDYQPTL